MAIKENLRKAMDAKRVSEYKLAQVTGVPQPTIHRILTGESVDPKTRTVRPLARYFGLTPDELRAAPKGKEMNEETPTLSALSQDAIDLLQAWERLPVDRRQAYKDMMYMEVLALTEMPWLRRGRPIRESYDVYERRMRSLATSAREKQKGGG